MTGLSMYQLVVTWSKTCDAKQSCKLSGEYPRNNQALFYINYNSLWETDALNMMANNSAHNIFSYLGTL